VLFAEVKLQEMEVREYPDVALADRRCLTGSVECCGDA